MLEKRTNILFDNNLWVKLKSLSKDTNRSMGDLVRSAVEKEYFRIEQLKERDRAIADILKGNINRKAIKIDYKELVNAGRKR